MTLAQDYLNGTDHDYTTATHVVEFEESVCGHSAGCPCAGRVHERVVDYYLFADGSVYMDDFTEKVFSDQSDFEDFLDSDNAIDQMLEYAR